MKIIYCFIHFIFWILLNLFSYIFNNFILSDVQFKMKNPDPDTVILKYVDGIHRKVVLNKTVERAIGINPVITNGIYLFEIIYKNIYNH